MLQDPIACVQQLKEMLRARRPSLDTIKAQIEPLKTSNQPNLERKRLVTSNSVFLKNVTVERVQMPYNLTAAGSELLERVVKVLKLSLKNFLDNFPNLYVLL